MAGWLGSEWRDTFPGAALGTAGVAGEVGGERREGGGGGRGRKEAGPDVERVGSSQRECELVTNCM